MKTVFFFFRSCCAMTNIFIPYQFFRFIKFSQGCAYVKFVKPSSAFSALEECDEKYRAVIAEPRVPRDARSGM